VRRYDDVSGIIGVVGVVRGWVEGDGATGLKEGFDKVVCYLGCYDFMIAFYDFDVFLAHTA
jgi:hypothetical protein